MKSCLDFYFVKLMKYRTIFIENWVNKNGGIKKKYSLSNFSPHFWRKSTHFNKSSFK